MKQNSLIRLISKILTLLADKQLFKMHLLPNISRSKDNKTMKYI